MSGRPPKILFKTDAGPAIGMGHLMRCCALAAALEQRAPRSCHFEADLAVEARRILATAGVRCATATERESYDVAIVDLSSWDAAAVERIRRRARLLVRIDDCPPPDPSADVVIQPNLVEPDAPVAAAAHYRGRDFILLHPAYGACRPQPLGDAVRRVLLCFGGSDPGNLSLRLTRLLHDLPEGASYRLVLGPRYESAAALGRTADLLRGMTVLRGLPTLAEEMAACDLAVLSGGTLLYEACATGRPAIVLSQNDLQAREVEIFAAGGAIVDLGRHDRTSDAAIADTIRGLSADGARRRELSERARRMVDLDGAARAAERILFHLREAEPA